MTASGFTNQGEFIPQNLIAGEFPRITRVITIKAGTDLTQGAVLGKITTTGQYVLSNASASDGSEIPEAILAEDAAAASGDAEAAIYLTGEFNENALQIGAGHTVAALKDHFRTRSLFLKANQEA